MITTFIISFREFLEAFLIIGVFLGISKRLKIKREREILIAGLIGFLISFLLPISVFIVGKEARNLLTEERAEILEGYLMVFSGLFLAYVTFSLHKFFVLKRSKLLISAHQKLEKNLFDISLFLTIVFLIVREGFEIALFTTTTSLFNQFIENLSGLFLGLIASSLIGGLIFTAYIKLSLAKIFKLTEYFIILLGASFVKNGLSELLEIYHDIHLSKFLPIKLDFLPDKSTLLGGLINSLFGLEKNLSGAKIALMGLYILFILLIFKRTRTQPT